VLAQKLILSYATKIVLQVFQIGASIVVARVAGPTVLGTVAFGLAYVSMFQFVSELGLGNAHIKLVSEGNDLGKCISTYARLKFFTTCLYVIVTISIFLSQKYAFNTSFESQTHEYVILIFLVMVTSQSFLTIPNVTFAAKTEQAKQDVPEFLRNIFLQISRIIAVLLGYRALTLAFCNLTSALIVVPLVLFLFRGYPFGGYDAALAKRYIKLAIPLIFIAVSATLVRTLDKVLLQFFSSSEQVGYYAAGYRIGNFILIIATSVGMLFFPLFSQAASRKNYEYIKATIEKFERFSFLFIMPAVIFFAIYSDTIVLTILGETYIPSIGVLSLISVAMFIMVLNMPYGNVLTGLGLFFLSAKISLANVVFFSSALFVLIHPDFLGLNAIGAAYGILASNIMLGVLFRIFAKQKLSNLDVKGGFRYLIFGLINFGAFFLLYAKGKNEWGMIFLIIFPLLYFALTFLILIMLGWIKKQDWQMLMSLFNLRAMKKYIDSEISFTKMSKS